MALNSAKLRNEIIARLPSRFPRKDLSVFLVRFGANFSTLLNLFERIYGQREDVEEQLYQLVLAMAEMYLARSPELRKLDRQREEDKNWYMSPNWVATMLYVDRFSGDLKGFTEKINYLEELGINYVHLMPLLKMPKEPNDGGYAVSDYRSVEERFGTMEDIREIAGVFRSRNMLLELDLVLNHTSNEHEWARKAAEGDKECQEMYYMYDDRGIPDLFEQTLPEIFPETAPGNFTYVEALNKWVFTTFNTFQWDLNYSNPRVFTEMAKILLNLANQGVDVLRLDVVAFMWKRLGTQCQNLDEAHLLLQMFKACTKITAPGAIFKAEAIVQPKEIVKYLGGGVADECEIAYNASFMVYLWDTMATRNKLILENGLKNIPRLPSGTTWINYIRCHDDIGLGYADQDILNAGFNPFEHRQFIISYYVGEFEGSTSKGQRFMYNPRTKDARITGSTASLLGLERAIEENNRQKTEDGIRRILLMHGLIMSFGGIPLVYYGDEVAHLNDYSYIEDASKANDSRWLNRPVIDWDKVKLRHQSGTVEQRVFDGLRKMIAIRKNLPEFHNANDYRLLENDNPQVFTFVRQQGWQRALVAANLSGGVQRLPRTILDHAGFGHFVFDAYEDRPVNLGGGQQDGQLVLEPYQFLWLKQR